MIKNNDVIYITLKDIRNKLKDFFVNRTLIPIIGAGFTKGEKSGYSIVPDGKELNGYMKKKIINKGNYTADDLSKSELQDTYDIFSDEIEINERRRLFSKYFIDIKLSEYKRKFLEINWWYTYTLNIDDAIERNSKYNSVIDICRPININGINNGRHVLKLHGDVHSFVNYDDAKLIFSLDEYLNSIRDNHYLLAQLKTDYESNNIIYIGCSLSNELDILSVASIAKCNNDVYLVSDRKFSRIEISKIKKYKISHVILIDDYDEFYDEIYKIWKETESLTFDNIKPIDVKYIEKISNDYDINLEYLLMGKILYKNDRVKLPYFYIERSCINNILEKINNDSVVFVNGKICSGKTYLLYGLAKSIVNRNVYVLTSESRINNDSLSALMECRNSVILADEKSLETDQIENVFKYTDCLKNKNITIVLFSNNQKGEIEEKIYSYNKYNVNTNNLVYYLKNNFSKDESEKISNKLASCAIEIFTPKQSIINNIVRIGESLKEKTKFDDIEISLKTIKEIAAMIVILTEKKTYLKKAHIFNIVNELDNAVSQTSGLLEKEKTMLYERNSNDTSSVKYVINAEYWLLKKIRDFAVKPKYYNIVSAYKYIIENLIACYGSPNINYYYNDAYKEYIKFDNINKIFYWNSSNNKLNLIKMIYDEMSNLLSADPRYMHQKAKCYIRLAYASNEDKDKAMHLFDAHKFIRVSISIFKQRYSDSSNHKVKISLDRAIYTAAVITCYIAKVYKYKIEEYNFDAIRYMYLAFSSENNTYQYANNDDTFKYEEYFQELIVNNITKNEYMKYRDEINYLVNFYKKFK